MPRTRNTSDITRTPGSIRLYVVLAHLSRVLLRAVYAPLKLLPARRKVTMISREHSTVPSDFTDLRASILAADPTVRIVMLARVVRPGIRAKLGYAVHLLRQMFHAATSRALVIDTYSLVASLLHHKRSLTVIQMWHALGAFKKFGLSIIDSAEGRDARIAKAMRMHRGYDFVLTSSEASRDAYSQALGTPRDRVLVAPLPRVDRIRDPQRVAQTRERIYARHPHLRDERIALYAPTFRMDGAFPVDAGELSRALSEAGFSTIVKMHPLMPAAHSVDTAEGFSTLELLTVADLLVTDYSTTVIEAGLNGVPSYFLVPDLDDYLRSRGFYVDYRGEMPGPIVRTIAELVEAVRVGAARAEDSIAFAQRWVEIPGDPPPAAGSMPCSDEIARLVLGRIG